MDRHRRGAARRAPRRPRWTGGARSTAGRRPGTPGQRPAGRGRGAEPRPRRRLLHRARRPRSARRWRRADADADRQPREPARAAVRRRPRGGDRARPGRRRRPDGHHLRPGLAFEPAVRAISEAHADIWRTVGTHPHEAKEDPELGGRDPGRAGRPSARASASARPGLDFHYDLSPRDVQARVFRAHIAAARADRPAAGGPHPRGRRRRWPRSWRTSTRPGPFKLLMHCYTSGPELLARAAALGAWFSVSGIATFKSAEDVRERGARHAGRPDHRRDRLPLPGADPASRPAQRAGLRRPGAGQAGRDPRLEPRPRPRRAPRPPSSTCSTGYRAPDDRDAGSHHPGLRLLRRRAARRRRLGRLRSGRPAQPPHPLLADGAPAVGARGRSAGPRCVVDTSPEFRLQTADAGARRLDALLLTHDHADQSHGIDDIRAFALRQRAAHPLPRGRGRPTQTLLRALRLHLPRREGLSGHLPTSSPSRRTARPGRSRGRRARSRS